MQQESMYLDALILTNHMVIETETAYLEKKKSPGMAIVQSAGKVEKVGGGHILDFTSQKNGDINMHQMCILGKKIYQWEGEWTRYGRDKDE